MAQPVPPAPPAPPCAPEDEFELHFMGELELPGCNLPLTQVDNPLVTSDILQAAFKNQ